MTDAKQAAQPAARDCRCPPGLCYGDAPVQACWMDWHHRNPSAFSLPAAIAAADHAATERACAAVCVLCRHGKIWLPAVEDGESGFWMHRHSNPDHHQGPMICDASAIREAAEKAKAQL